MDTALLTALKLSKAGFGTAVQILDMPVDIVLGALNYNSFVADYEAAYYKLNKPK